MTKPMIEGAIGKPPFESPSIAQVCFNNKMCIFFVFIYL